MVLVGLVNCLHHWHLKHTDVTAYIPSDSCTYLSPALRGMGRAPWSSMSKLIGLTKSLGLAKYTQKKQPQFILMGICKALREICIARSCFQTVHRVNKQNPGRISHEVIAFLSKETFFSFFKLSAAFTARSVRVSYHEYVRFSVQSPASIRRRWR